MRSLLRAIREVVDLGDDDGATNSNSLPQSQRPQQQEEDHFVRPSHSSKFKRVTVRRGHHDILDQWRDVHAKLDDYCLRWYVPCSI